MNADRRRYLLVMALGTLGLLVAGTVGATNVMDTAMTNFQTQINSIQSTTVSYGTKLLISLVTIQLGVSGYMSIFGNADFGELFKGLLVKNILIMGFFFALIHGSSTYLQPIINTFTQMGQQSSGLSNLTPSAVIDQGIDVMQVMFSAFGKASSTASGSTSGGSSGFSVTGAVASAISALSSNLLAALQMVLLSFIFFISFVGLALGLALTTIQGYLWTAVTPFLLGFGGLNFTRDMAITALKGGFSIGMKIFLTYVIVGVATGLAQAIGTSLATMTLTNMYPLWEAAATGLFFLVLAWAVPKMASDLLNGTSSMSPGEAIGQAATVIAGALGAGAAGAAAMGAAGKAGVNAAAGATGLARALSAGMNSGLDLGKSGTALAAHTMGEVGSHGLGLMKGAIGGAGSAFAQKVDSSAGGKIASSINATRGGSMSGIPVPPDAKPGGSGGSGGGSGGGDSGGSAPGGSSGGGDSGTGGSGAAASPVDASNAGSSPVDASSAGAMPADASSAGASPTDTASAGTPAVAPPGAPPGSGGIPVPTPQSDGSSAAISGGSGSSNPVKPPKSALSRTQEGLQSFASQMPQDGHTVGVNANISHSLGE